MARACSEDGGYFNLQENNPLPNRRQDEEMKVQTKVARFCIKPLKTKRRLLNLKNQLVPRSKHFSSRL